MKLVRIHKQFNRSAIPFYREKAIDFFSEIMKRWNNMYDYEPLKFKTSELKKALNIDSRNNEYFNEFILQFSKDTTTQFKIGKDVITGNAFTFSQNLENDRFVVKLNDELREYIFTKSDIELMKKNKRKEKMNPKELEEHKKRKEKYKNLMMYSQAELLNFKSKYTKRLYMLLIQFKNTGKFIMNYDEFKKVMEVPKSYNQGHIDEHVFKKSKQEIEEKTEDIKIKEIVKDKKGGRSIKNIEIYFECNKKRFHKINKEDLREIGSNEMKEEYINEDIEERNQKGLENIRKIRESFKK